MMPFQNFVEQNPHWEIEWLKDREKALSRTVKRPSSDSDDNAEKRRKKRKDKHLDLLKDKKKKKRSKKRRHRSSDTSSSSSSSSDSSSDDDEEDENNANDKSKSIRVAMRNVKVEAIMNEDLGSKWEMLGRLMEEHKQKEAAAKEAAKEAAPVQEDRLINQWMTISEPPDKEKHMLSSLKDRMKQKQEAEKTKLAELERKQREKEREEAELQQKKEKEEREAREREEASRREKERQEFERIRDRDREQVRFKTRDKYRKRSASSSPKRRDSRSPSSEKRKSRHRSPPVENHRQYSENGRSSTERRRSDYDDSSSHKRRYDDRDSDSHRKDRKPPPPPPSYKKLPFIGRMPLFKNKKPEEKVEKEIKKEDYEPQRQSRFQPGNLARAFIPEPEVVCFPKLSSIPPITIPQPAVAPAPPKITEPKPPKAPPPPKIGKETKNKSASESAKQTAAAAAIQENNYGNMMYSADQMAMYQYGMMYQQMYENSQDVSAGYEVPPEISGIISDVPLAHTLPLPPPPLPPDDPNDDLAMLGISADDMAAQMF